MTRAGYDEAQRAVVLVVDGRRGEDGRPGRRGTDALGAGADGGDGGPATAPTRGRRGGAIDVVLSSVAPDHGVSWHGVRVVGAAIDAEDDREAADLLVPFRDFTELVTSARGGDGGHGSDGGPGGDGARGRRGSNATRYSSGTRGGAGGDGGDGGPGSSGADAGDGGLIRVLIDERDTYLLMAVAGAEAPDERVAGGSGGRPGRHGPGGSGGLGGPGGSSYHWTETHTRTESYTDSEGRSQTRLVTYTTHHSNPGGSTGPSGRAGRSPTTPLTHGRSGAHGTFEIRVRAPDGERVYPRRYDLALDAFDFVEPDAPDDDGIYEPGERLAVTRLRFTNTGRMPTPAFQRARVTLLAGEWVRPLRDEAFLPLAIPAEGQALVEDRLHFQIRDVTIQDAGDPLLVLEEVRPRAEQLGVEVQQTEGPDAPFRRPYARVTFSRTLTVRFPVENRDGIRVLRSLGPGEQSRIVFEVRNISSRAIGRASERKRPVAVHLEWVGGDVSAEQLVFFDADGAEHAFVVEGARAGYFAEIPLIEAGGSVVIEGRVGFRKDVKPYADARLRYTILLDDLGPEERLRVVQMREVTLRVEPGYRWEPDTRVLLVANNNTTREAYEAWHQLLEEQLGLPVDDWSLTRYGHFDHSADVGDGTDLRAHLWNKLVVLLNHPFHPRSDDTQEMPADYLRPADFRRGATANNTHTLVIGGHLDMIQLLAPNTDVRRGGDDFPNARSFLKKERRTGGPLVEEVFHEDVTSVFDVVQVDKLSFPFFRPSAKALRKAALRLQKKLCRMHPNRRYVLVYKDRDPPVKVGCALGLIPRWDIGSIEVRRTLNDETSSAVTLRVDGALQDAGFILGEESRFAVLLALSFEDKLDRLAWLLRAPGDHFGEVDAKSADALVEAIWVDLAEEQAALRKRRDGIDEKVMSEKLASLVRLVDYPLPTELAVGSNRWRCLVKLCAGLGALVESQSPWWRLVGRNASINRFTEAKLAQLVAQTFNAYALDPHGDVAMEGETAGARIDVERQRLLARIEELRRAHKASGERLARTEAGLRFFLHPSRARTMTRDIDAWQVPDDRVWSLGQLRVAQQEEARRQRAQAELRERNAGERAAMLVLPEGKARADPATSAAVRDERQVELAIEHD